jgi:hypothetical protein
MKGWILLLIALFLLQAAALAAASSFFDGDFEGVPDNDNGLATLYLVLNLLVFGVMLTTQLLPQQREPMVFEQRLLWANYVKRDGLATLYLVLNLLVFGIMLTTQLLPQQRDPLVFEQRLLWANYVKWHTKKKRNHTFTHRIRMMELKSFNKLLELIQDDLKVN